MNNANVMHSLYLPDNEKRHNEVSGRVVMAFRHIGGIARFVIIEKR